MENSGSCKSAERVDLEGVLHRWFAAQGVSEEGATRAVRLLDASTLLAQPRPSHWNRRGAFGIQERCRYLWYRHAARILGWCECRRFPDIVTGILRTHVFPTQAGRDEATREDGAGRVPADAHAGPPQIATDPSDAGQSSTFSNNTRPGFRVSVAACGLGLIVFSDFRNTVLAIYLRHSQTVWSIVYVLGMRDPIGHLGSTARVTKPMCGPKFPMPSGCLFVKSRFLGSLLPRCWACEAMMESPTDAAPPLYTLLKNTKSLSLCPQ